MSSFHTSRTLSPFHRIVFPAYMGAAVAATVVIGFWIASLQTGPHLAAEHVETNEEGAWFKITDVRGADGRPLAWDELDTSVSVHPIMDRDGIVQVEEPFFVPTSRPGMTHLITIAYAGDVLWSGAFHAPAEPALGLLDISGIPDPPAPPPGVPTTASSGDAPTPGIMALARP